jgi:hypothetical protein
MPVGGDDEPWSTRTVTRIGQIAVTLGWCSLTSCATIVSGPTQNIRVTSSPSGATVTAEPGGDRVTTPAKMTLQRKGAPYRLTFALQGYQPYRVIISADTNGWAYGNFIFGILLGGVVGGIIDSSSGAAYTLSPDEVHANLIRAGVEPQSSAKSTLYVFASDGMLLGTIDLE